MIRAKKSMLTIFCNLRSFVVVDLFPQDTTFDAAYFIAQMITQLHELHSITKGDNTRHKLCLHFDNSSRHTAHAVVDEMVRLRCQQV
jgi:hypothetical protein